MDLAILDTDTLSEVLKRKHPQVLKNAGDYFVEHGQFAFSVMTRYEVLRGLREKKAQAQLARFGIFCSKSLVLPLTDPIFDRAGDLSVAARGQGRPARDADLLIAATTLEAGRVLVTGNASHFSWIPGIRLSDWRVP
jgi:tRNA(fMet)-specific endonuclease VapC